MSGGLSVQAVGKRLQSANGVTTSAAGLHENLSITRNIGREIEAIRIGSPEPSENSFQDTISPKLHTVPMCPA